MGNNFKININTILCANADEKVSNIEKIFNVLKQTSENTVSFDVVTVMSAVGKHEDMKEFTLVYAFLKKETATTAQISIAGMEEFEIELGNPNKEDDETYTSQFLSVRHVRDAYFPGSGMYELRVYKFEDEVGEEVLEEIRMSNKHEDKIECVSSFKIID